ncbi:polysaccharide deacetylase family protein [Pusillimonas sp. CC-YST705]|uniref:Polysaccharide deacetylase family protein n=1 Tax=Mesopusillimonas faecipullorum TaxID=2755040 RepID=A0ABS8C995_9BURK|nr:polysaccharide deacetylase family protein [Mesopusillimonas faecipullorum]MCB5362588.1 polysaccharide deacetylase family protein [Mesopusillimonas faecipullorum]
MQEPNRFDYSPIVGRPRLTLPDGARVAVWVIPNVEHFLFDRPSTSITAVTTGLVPDVLNYSWRDYGPRVGFWRMLDVMNKHGIRGTAALNSDVCGFYPQLIQAGNESGWEWMAHGRNNSQMVTRMEEEEERELIRHVIDTIHQASGTRPRGWLSPALSETVNTPDLLAEAGIEYTANWVNDEQPYPMKVKQGTLTSLPYAIEINDIPAFLDLKQSGEQFAKMICDTFDVLHEDAQHGARVMAISIHPFLIGHPHRSKPFDRALQYIRDKGDVWFATGSEILDWYQAQRV